MSKTHGLMAAAVVAVSGAFWRCGWPGTARATARRRCRQSR